MCKDCFTESTLRNLILDSVLLVSRKLVLVLLELYLLLS